MGRFALCKHLPASVGQTEFASCHGRIHWRCLLVSGQGYFVAARRVLLAMPERLKQLQARERTRLLLAYVAVSAGIAEVDDQAYNGPVKEQPDRSPSQADE